MSIFACMKPTIHFLLRTAVILCALCCWQQTSAKTTSHSFTAGKGTFLLDGKPFVVKAAEVHYPRIPRAYWEHRIRMCKALGMNTLCLYVFWNIHEQREGVFDFTGNNDVVAFCRLAQKHGMYVIVRPGPYVCAEWEMGGLPWWLLKKKDIRLREQDPYFMERVALFEEKVAEQLAPLSIDHGGPIIMVQVENEYGSYGDDGDPLDVLVLCSEVLDPLTLVRCYPIGYISMLDGGRNDEKIIAIPFSDPSYNKYRDIMDLPDHTFDEMAHFFTVYKALEGKEAVAGDVNGREAAVEIIKSALAHYDECFGNKQ